MDAEWTIKVASYKIISHKAALDTEESDVRVSLMPVQQDQRTGAKDQIKRFSSHLPCFSSENCHKILNI